MIHSDLSFKKLQKDLSQILKKNILEYWINNTIDEAYGGFIGQINSDNTKVPESSKGIILNARILWTFSIAYRQYNDEVYLKIADRAYKYIQNNFRDEKYGGVYWELSFKGQPIDKRKQVYAQAFTIYALAEYYLVTKNENAQNWAIDLFHLLEEKSHDATLGGYIEAFGEDWSAMDDVRLSEKDANEKKTMNTHLHVLEAYTNLLRIWRNNEVIEAQKKLIKLFLDKFLNEDGHLNLFFTEEWKLKSDVVSFGHDIEAAWLLVEAAEVVGDEQLIVATQAASVKIASVLIDEGIDVDGSVLNERDGSNGVLDTDKHWWPQAEAMVGFMNAYQHTGDIKYATSIFKLWDFINDKIIDHKQGEWFWRVDVNGNAFSEDEKVGFWKCPYHNARACVELIERIDTLTELGINEI